MLTVPILVGTVVEPLVLAATRRLDRRVPLVGALLLMAGAAAATTGARTPVALALCISAWGVGSGVATSLAEVALVARSRDPHRTMLRWAFSGSVGDLAAPLLYAGCALAGLSWRHALWVGAAAAAVDALAVALGPRLLESPGDDEAEGPRSPLREAARRPDVWRWLVAAAACTLFDEVLVSLSALWLREQGLGAAAAGTAIAAFAVGAAAGQAASERLLSRLGIRAVLALSCAGTAAAWIAWMAAPAWAAIPLGLAVGACAAPMWALCTSSAYATGASPAAVAALSRVLGPVDLVAPWALGLLADRHGLQAALAALLLQPLVVAACAWGRRRAARGRRPVVQDPPPPPS